MHRRYVLVHAGCLWRSRSREPARKSVRCAPTTRYLLAHVRQRLRTRTTASLAKRLRVVNAFTPHVHLHDEGEMELNQGRCRTLRRLPAVRHPHAPAAMPPSSSPLVRPRPAAPENVMRSTPAVCGRSSAIRLGDRQLFRAACNNPVAGIGDCC